MMEQPVQDGSSEHLIPSKEEFQKKRGELNPEKARLTQRLELNTAIISRGEEDLEQALPLASNLGTLWAEADEEGRREILETVFVKFVVDHQRIVDMEMRPPHSWLLRLKGGRREAPVVDSESTWPSKLTGLGKGSSAS